MDESHEATTEESEEQTTDEATTEAVHHPPVPPVEVRDLEPGCWRRTAAARSRLGGRERTG